MEVRWPPWSKSCQVHPKKCPLGEVLMLISQQGPEILNSLNFVMICPNGGRMASTVKILSSTSKKRPLGEVLVLISQQGPEILSSLHFVMICPN